MLRSTSSVNYHGRTLHGEEAARVLIEHQIDGIRKAVAAGMLVKVNSVMVPGVNADHLPAVAKKAKELGAYIVNMIPLIPVPGTKFEGIRAPTSKERKQLQDACEVDIRQMRHCRHCRADAIGLLGEDRSAEFANITCCAESRPAMTAMTSAGTDEMRVAVATTDGRTVNEHFGMAETFRIYSVKDAEVLRDRSR